MKFINNSLIFIIKIYKYFISPFFPFSCRYLPTCSEYFVDALRTHGVIIGVAMGLKRISRCHPIKFLGGNSGYDPVKKLKKERR
tara:strand:- start:184 stop:435 length:252 start_codon:yes stop_codon:yes gene_type:complete